MLEQWLNDHIHPIAHVSVSALIYMLIVSVLSPRQRGWAVPLTMAVGLFKELYIDVQFSPITLAYNALGVALGLALTVHLLVQLEDAE